MWTSYMHSREIDDLYERKQRNRKRKGGIYKRRKMQVQRERRQMRKQRNIQAGRKGGKRDIYQKQNKREKINTNGGRQKGKKSIHERKMKEKKQWGKKRRKL